MPAAAAAPCALYVLPENPAEGDLDIAYATRGANLVSCDAARRLAVATWAAEHELQEHRMKSRRGWRGRWFN